MKHLDLIQVNYSCFWIHSIRINDLCWVHLHFKKQKRVAGQGYCVVRDLISHFFLHGKELIAISTYRAVLVPEGIVAFFCACNSF